ncbi:MULTISPECIES: ATP phosphoribosyltransferase regulatory subunit [Burkholderia]|jgi:ATP phosphoribosyltransferase regulatory subunit|uniref:ATP phosphoribosyltransferase regulatory subunit n=1 Tax=Burkholderia gladioli TaxID=28095 RepID=A0AB38TLE5_BURGA|nr:MULTISPECIES: ATP phosphoribosyltransferase regulatory subunit [Burkholderia]KAF1062073.1 ATP phosphoribosyltransferase regulatory subunit [Burkholderia gladioli]KKJ02914.1 ATP phosphoribosyltransferase regulatory subunit [Burkholderia gladioli]MBA1361864.1 ATP phosphoribosyltransferase regulatory subunit [Burkholderia gladioli]MBJ9673313.1 ATP phosphoribosyltransferase regulatory subunit [Burkholderia gladioli]MBU9188874.1 ATP phosphoribosyltransferase regulatory subunit [Burkholderia glad
MSTWLLPENIADVLPSEARKIEELRRRLLDRFRSYGYEMVMPPLLEYLESLLTGGGNDLHLRTFKLVDELSGRTLGLRADMTPQVARIDAHLLNRQGVTRLCYAGNVLHTRPRGLHATREQIQIGAELYGHAGLEADLEVQQLMLDALRLTGIGTIRLDLCHAGVLNALFSRDAVAAARGETLYGALAGKDVPLLNELTEDLGPDTRAALRALPHLYGDASVIDEARRQLPALPEIARALDDLAQLAAQVQGAEVAIDLADLRGYAYHSGAMFSAYVDGVPNAVARGGRYDHVGQAYGRARPATGFSLDLREIARISPIEARGTAILAPWRQDEALRVAVAALRDAGEVVIQALPGHDHVLDEFACDRVLVEQGGAWLVQTR